MKTKTPLYHKFVNENNLNNIHDVAIQRKFSIYSFWTLMLFLFSIALNIPIGFNLENLFTITLSVISIILFLLGLYLGIRFILLDRKYHVFRKHWYLIAYLTICFLPTVAFYIYAVLTTYLPLDSEFSRILTLSIYVPIMLLLYFLSCFAFVTCFMKYTKCALYYRIKKGKLTEDDLLLNTDTTNCFYHKFVNEDNLKNIEYRNIRDYFYERWALILQYLSLSAFWITIAGYGFESILHIINFIVAFLFVLLGLFTTVEFIYFDHKYHVFKKHWYLYLFLSIFYILVIAFYILAYFRIDVISPYNEDVQVSINIFLFLYIYIPLFATYWIICKHAFVKCFKKYTKFELRLSHKKINLDNQENEIINQKESEDLSSDSSEQ